MTPSVDILGSLRRVLLAILLFGLAGTTAELLLIGHDEDVWQLIPLVVLGTAIVASVTMVMKRSWSSTMTRAFQCAMVFLILSGAAGAVLHYRANMEFQLEMDPSVTGFALFSKVVQAKAPPALAPGNMALLGLLGLACVFRLDVRAPSLGS